MIKNDLIKRIYPSTQDFQKMAVVSESNWDKRISVAQDKFLVSVRFVQRYS